MHFSTTEWPSSALSYAKESEQRHIETKYNQTISIIFVKFLINFNLWRCSSDPFIQLVERALSKLKLLSN